jgi:hypothetical protein
MVRQLADHGSETTLTKQFNTLIDDGRGHLQKGFKHVESVVAATAP